MIEQSIELTEQDKKWLDAQVASGRYKSIGEVIHKLIEPWNVKPMTNEQLRAEIQKGRDSGYSKTRPEDLLAKFKRELG
ncbi:MAG: type II toxin-antitoxin system ParD family antitoxin [Litorimonas sp.]